MDTNRKIFLLTYGTPLMYVGTLHKDLGKIADTTTEKSVLPVEYYLPVDVGDHIEVTMEIILQVSDKVKSEK